MIEIRAQAAPWHSGVEIMVRDGENYVKTCVMERLETGLYYEPTFRLNSTEAQVLIDDLWRAGFRPTEGTGSAGALAATERHLEDMRTLVFNGGKP